MGALRTGGQGSVYKGRRIGPIISAVKLLPTPVHSESMDDVNYRSFINEPLGEDRITSLMDELLPLETDFVIRTAAGGLY